MTQESVAAIIVTCNRLAKLKRAVLRFLEQDISGLVVVDNLSADGTADWLKSLQSDRLIVCFPENNIGGAGGFALGCSEAKIKFNPDWFLLCDDDAYPDKGLIKQFLATKKDDRTGIISAAVYTPDKEIAEMNRPLLNMPQTRFDTLKYFGGQRSKFVLPDLSYKAAIQISVQGSSFVGCFIRKTVIEKLGLPRKELFLYGDDLIYTQLSVSSGYRNLFCSNLIFYHDIVTGDKDIQPVWKIFYLMRNQIEVHRSVNKCNVWLPALIRFLFHLKNIIHQSQKREYLKYLFLGFYDGIRRRFSRNVSCM
jgi:rhamnopyranosyl-N-acetylglucosaminyl-diphospho-decaprenol beta-1,3/1,4-galactofuranosyltransferase